MKKIAVIGAGHVGLVTAACFAKLENSVICVDNDQKKIDGLKKGIMPFFEPGLEELVKKSVKKRRLSFSFSIKEATENSEIIFIAVGTPSKEDGGADLSAVEAVTSEIAKAMKGYKLLVEKSTVPVMTGEWVKRTINLIKKKEAMPTGRQVDFDVAANPEFLREGSAILDFLKPERIIIGAESERAKRLLKELYQPIKAPIIFTDVRSAELIKHASNSFLATKISYINAIASVCEEVGADVKSIAKGMGCDSRIGQKFLSAGVGYGGSCLTENEVVIIKKNNNVFPLKIRELFNKKHLGSEVLSFDINEGKVLFKPIIKVSKRKYKGDIITIRTGMNKMLSCTEDHPFIVYENNKFVLKLADDMLLSDKLPSFTNMPDLNKNFVIDAISILPKDKFDFKKVRVRPLNKQFKDVKGELNLFKASRLRDVLRSNCMNLEEYLEVESRIKDKISRGDLMLFTSRGNTTYCPAIIAVDHDFCRFLGYYVSEGNIHYERDLRATRARINIHFNINEKEYIEDLENILKKYSVKYDLRKNEKNSTMSFYFSSIILAFVLNNYLVCGKDSSDANVPDLIFSLDKEKRKEFLLALFKGDGHVAFPKNTNSVVYDYGSINYNLVHNAILLLSSIGIVPSYKKSISKKSSDYAHFFRVSTKKQIVALRNFKDRETQKKIDNMLNKCKDIKSVGFERVNSDFCVVKIKKLEKEYREVNVYSIETKDTNTFITSHGLIIHNCFPKDVTAFIHLAEEAGYDFSLLKAVQRINQEQLALVFKKIKKFLWTLKNKTIGILGLSFKPNTDDIREAPSIKIIKDLLSEGAILRVYDPKAMGEIKKIFPDLTYCKNPYEVCKGSELLLILTEWEEFKRLDLKRVKKLLQRPYLIDGRNIYEPERMKKLGFIYEGIGRK